MPASALLAFVISLFLFLVQLRLPVRELSDWLRGRQRCRYYRRAQKGNKAGSEDAIKPFRRTQPKPAWVKKEVLRLKALMPDGSCRKIKEAFNRRFAGKRNMTVGKTFVSETIKKHKYEIEVLRKEIKRRPPRRVPRNHIWAMDMTGKTDNHGKTHMLLGILDHGSRAALRLQALPNKSSWTLLGHLFLAIGQHGKPRSLRTDNEAVFTSRLFRFALLMLGIRHQTTDLHCPWQNGRIERLFGTLKEKLNQLSVSSCEALNVALAEFRFYYNHVRPHQNLGGATPAEVWAGIDPYRGSFKKEYWFDAWEGLLQGYYLRR